LEGRTQGICLGGLDPAAAEYCAGGVAAVVEPLGI
jgi:hypothetical protein